MPDRVPTSIGTKLDFLGVCTYIPRITPRKKMDLKSPVELEFIQISIPEKPNQSLDKIAHNTVLFGIFP